MALKALKCPSCEANIQLDTDKDYGFCTYCGTQIQIREVVEVRHIETIKYDDSAQFHKRMEDAQAYLKMEEYHRAEQAGYRLINEYPGKAEAYELLICAITHNYKIFIVENVDRVMKLANKMLAVASDTRTGYYEKLYQEIVDKFEVGMQEQAQQKILLKIARMNKQMKENAIVCLVCAITFAVCWLWGESAAWMQMFRIVIGIIGCASLFTVIVLKLAKNMLLRKGRK